MQPWFPPCLCSSSCVEAGTVHYQAWECVLLDAISINVCVCVWERKSECFKTSLVNTGDFYVSFYKTNRQRYLQQKHRSTDIICLCQLKDNSLDSTFLPLLLGWEKWVKIIESIVVYSNYSAKSWFIENTVEIGIIITNSEREKKHILLFYSSASNNVWKHYNRYVVLGKR